jgi:CubicO group peptidase (beta-lactamase class C family)
MIYKASSAQKSVIQGSIPSPRRLITSMATNLLTTLSWLAPMAALLIFNCPPESHAEEYPGTEWSKATPAEAGLDEAKLHQARDYALTGGGSGYITRGGKLVLSWGDLAQRYDIKSSTKSFGAAALGLAIKDGKMRLDDKAQKHHPGLGTPPVENAKTGWLDEVTILHLASQTAGFEKPGGFTAQLFRPGTQWDYSDSVPNWLAECITLAYHRDVDELMFERVFTPLGIQRDDLVWRKNQYRPDLIDGIKRREFGAGISANVDAMARFGLLWLRGGKWGDAQILPGDYVDQVRTTMPGVHGLPMRVPEEYGKAANHYGLLWWNNADETIEGLPLDAYWSWGLYDSLYTAYGDGFGFDPFVKGKLSAGLAKVTGTPPDIHGINIRSETAEAMGDGKHGRKASGMLSVDGVLYLLMRNAGNSQLGWSTDHGVTWTWADWKFTESFGCPTFLSSQGHAGAG